MGQDNYDTQSIQTHQTTKTIVTTKTEAHIKLEITDKTDYVLIDLREESAFEKYRILEGSRLLTSDQFSRYADSERQVSATDVLPRSLALRRKTNQAS